MRVSIHELMSRIYFFDFGKVSLRKNSLTGSNSKSWQSRSIPSIPIFFGSFCSKVALFLVASETAIQLVQQIPLYLSNKAAIFLLSTDPADDPRLSG